MWRIGWCIVMSNVNFDRPFLLILLPIILVAIVISFIISVNKENRTKNNVISFILHLMIAIFVSLAIAQTTYEKVITETDIYVLADVSYSSNKNLDLIDEYIKDLKKNSPKNSKIGVICFGKDQELLVDIGEKIKSVKEANIDESETDIASALLYASSLFKDNVIKRIVLISDGEETNESDLVSIVDSMSLDNIYVDAIYLDNNLNVDDKEVQINSVDYVSSTYLNYEETVSVYLQSNLDTRAIITLNCDGNEYLETAKVLEKGYNIVSFDLNTDTPGDHQYEIIVKTDDDTNEINNKFYFNQIVAEKLKVLFIGSSDSDMEAARGLYPDADISYYVEDYNIPYTVEDLCEYDEFVLSNVDIRNYKNHTQFVSSLNTLVSEFGKSLVTIGNTYIQNNEDDVVLSSLSDMLPVKFGNDDKKKTVTILLDISRSMEQLGRLIIAKKAACEILDKLDDDVKVSCITFYGEVKPLFILKDASERDSLKELINKAEAYQGTFLGAALGYTYKTVSAQDNTKNEVVLISDGLPYKEQASLSLHYATMMAEQSIVLSTIQTATVDNNARDLMKELAAIGKGNYSYIHEIEDVKDTIYNEVFNSLNETVLENQELPVSILLGKDKLVDGLESLSNVKGIYNNTAKASARVVLDALYTDVDDTQYRIPLYASWEYGNGRVSSFASTISGEWISLWNNSEDKKVLTNLIPVNSPTERLDSAFIMEFNNKGTKADIVVKAPTLNKDSILTIKVIYPNGVVEEKILASIIDANVQKYMTEIETNQVGEYVVLLSYSLGELIYSADYQFNISYLPEYDSFTIYEASNLYYMVSSNGQVSEDGHLVLENNYSNVEKYVVDFTPALMILSVVFFVIDIMVRKLRLQDIISLFKKITRNTEGAGK